MKEVLPVLLVRGPQGPQGPPGPRGPLVCPVGPPQKERAWKLSLRSSVAASTIGPKLSELLRKDAPETPEPMMVFGTFGILPLE